MTDVYFGSNCFGFFVYIGYPKTTGGYGFYQGPQNCFALVPPRELISLEGGIITRKIKPKIADKNLVDQITVEIGKLENWEPTSKSLNEKISLLIKNSKTPKKN